MNPDSNPSDIQEVHNPLHAMQTGEQTICEIKRHPIGIFIIYIGIVFVLALIGVFIFILLPRMMPGIQKTQIAYYGSLAMLLGALFGVVFAFANHVVYWGNRWIVTSDSITQVQQTGLFHKQASQLSLENLEDVTSEKNGILMQIFNYGVLKAETAGERSKFMFLYCPNPEEYAKTILNARELFMLDIREKESARLQQAVQTPVSPTPTP